jgi:hypothetical protein
MHNFIDAKTTTSGGSGKPFSSCGDCLVRYRWLAVAAAFARDTGVG